MSVENIQDKANIQKLDKRPIFMFLYNCWELKFPSSYSPPSPVWVSVILTLLRPAFVLEMNLTVVLKTKDTVTLILHSCVCLPITLLAPARRPCKSPMDSWASGAWRGSGGQYQWEREGQSQCRHRQRTRHSSIRSRLCPRSQSFVWLIDASLPVRWRSIDLGRREMCEHEIQPIAK